MDVCSVIAMLSVPAYERAPGGSYPVETLFWKVKSGRRPPLDDRRASGDKMHCVPTLGPIEGLKIKTALIAGVRGDVRHLAGRGLLLHQADQ